MTPRRPLALLPLLLLLGCHDEPTFVITFAPQDLTAAPAATTAPPRAADASTAVVPVAPSKDAGAAARTTPTPPATAIACKAAGDCAVAPVDCCDCSSGGK